jgi:alpha-glucosidase
MTDFSAPSDHDWWTTAVIYQIYPRSFADSDGDGIGDLPGITAHLPYVRDLGVDAIWFSPWYTSPMADAGYDIADPRDIDPSFGTLADADALIARAHELGLRIVVDVVPNHASTAHAWFTEALAAPAGDPARELFHFRDGRGPDGAQPPNNWESIFGGGAWTRLPHGQWYLHLFAPEQPDYNWDSALVRTEHEDILRFWFDRGADGVRIDSAALLVKVHDLADHEPDVQPPLHPYEDRDEVHDVYRRWRKVADSYTPPKALIGEIWLADQERFSRYLRPDELHTAFNFDFLTAAWDLNSLNDAIHRTLDIHRQIDATPTWVLSNHDVTRHVTRFGRAHTGYEHSPEFRAEHHGDPYDLALGLRRARAAAMLTFALPGSVYVYQGDELGLPEVEDIADGARQDPMFTRSGRANPGRDGCRVPLPWSGQSAPYGFSPAGSTAATWLPQPADWAPFTVDGQQRDPGSMLCFYRTALRLRHDEPAFGVPDIDFPAVPGGVLGFVRGGRRPVTCWVNLGDGPVPLPTGVRILLASQDVGGRPLPSDGAVWFTDPA